MVMPDHVCPYSLKSKDLLERRGFAVVDRHLTTRAETDAFQERHGVDTTPRTFIAERRIGGYDELRAHFGDQPPGPDDVTYRPVIAVFATAALMALAAWAGFGTVMTLRSAEWFVAFSMCLLAVQKLRDVEGFRRHQCSARCGLAHREPHDGSDRDLDSGQTLAELKVGS